MVEAHSAIIECLHRISNGQIHWCVWYGWRGVKQGQLVAADLINSPTMLQIASKGFGWIWCLELDGNYHSHCSCSSASLAFQTKSCSNGNWLRNLTDVPTLGGSYFVLHSMAPQNLVSWCMQTFHEGPFLSVLAGYVAESLGFGPRPRLWSTTTAPTWHR